MAQDNATEKNQAMVIVTWANGLAASLDNAIDPSVTTFLEKTVQTTCHQSIITARNLKLEEAVVHPVSRANGELTFYADMLI